MNNPVSLISCGDYSYENAFSKDAIDSIAKLTSLVPGRFGENLADADPELLEKIEILFTGWFSVTFDDEFLSKVPNLKAVFHAGGSIKKMVNSNEFWDKDIVICNAVEGNSVPVAEFCLGQILLSLKRYWHCLNITRKGGYKPYRWDMEFPGAYRRTVGLIGFGTIARRLTKLLENFDLKVIVYSLPEDEADILEAGAIPVPLDQLFQESDIVSLHLPLLDATNGLINGDHLKLMKENATFINTARGGLLQLDQLVKVARVRQDLTFLLDVMDPNPPDPEDPIYQEGNIWISPHLAGALCRECERMGDLMVEDLKRYLRGDPLVHRVERDQFHLIG